MGRPANGVPYLKGGVYHIRFKGDKDSTSLDTRNASEAKRKGAQVAANRGMTTALRESAHPKARAVPVTSAGPPMTTASGLTGGDALDGWLSSESEFDGGQVEPGTDRTHPDSPGFVEPQPYTEVAVSTPSKGLTSDEKSRMHGLLSGIVGRANVLALGLGVRIFGRVPAEPEPADLELLNRAWQLQLEELLEGKEVKPYVLIIAASAGLGVGMWAGGEPIPPKPKKGQQGETLPTPSQ